MAQELIAKTRLGGGRIYSMDLLRIVSMFMIVLLHSGSHGSTLSISDGINIYTIIFHLIESLTICSVDIFVLISGYFLCTQQFRPSRILKLYFSVLFYSLIWLFLIKNVCNEPISKVDIITSLLPLSYSQYWFITAYIGMYLLSPIINHLLKNLNRSQHIRVILVLLVLFSIWPDVFIKSNPTGMEYRGYCSIWFIVLYIIAAYLRFYPIKIKPSKTLGLYLVLGGILVLIWLIIAIATSAQSFENEVHDMLTFYYFRYNSFVVLAMSVFMFISFQNIKIKNERIQNVITYIAPLVMGVYLVHDNIFARHIVWQGIQDLEPTLFAPLIVLGYTLCIFIVCIAVDKFRSLLFSVVNQRVWYKLLLQRIDNLPYRIRLYIESKF